MSALEQDNPALSKPVSELSVIEAECSHLEVLVPSFNEAQESSATDFVWLDSETTEVVVQTQTHFQDE